ncbi:MAG: RNA polymerase sigma factor [Saprospiraceae bacterium]
MQPTNIEQELIKKCLKGDMRAQYELYNRYVTAMYNVALRIVSHQTEAEDVLQDSFTKVFQQLHTFRSEATIGAWIKRIVVTTALTHLRGKKKLQIIEMQQLPELEDDEQHEADMIWDAKTLHESIKKLPEGSRVVFTLFAVEGMSHKEIAKALNISESTSKTQYMRAKQLLKQQLSTILKQREF